MFERKVKEQWRDGTFLTTAKNTLEADIFESKLQGEGIPVIRRYSGAGNAMEIIMGNTLNYPIDLYVPEEALEDALNIIVPVPILSEDLEEYADIDIENENGEE